MKSSNLLTHNIEIYTIAIHHISSHDIVKDVFLKFAVFFMATYLSLNIIKTDKSFFNLYNKQYFLMRNLVFCH